MPSHAEFTIMRQMENQHGFGVSLVKYAYGELVGGFVLTSLDTEAEQAKYIADLAEMTGYRVED